MFLTTYITTIRNDVEAIEKEEEVDSFILDAENRALKYRQLKEEAKGFNDFCIYLTLN